MSRGSVPYIVEAHAEVAAMLYLQRKIAVWAPHYTLEQMVREDERLEAHLDGLRIAGSIGWKTAKEAFDAFAEPGESFVLAHLGFGIDAGDTGFVLEALDAMPNMLGPMTAALGWLPPRRLRGKILPLFEDQRPIVRALATSACSAHRADPGERLNALFDDVPVVRARAFRLAGELGKSYLLGHLGTDRTDNDGPCKFYRVWSGALLGERATSLHGLASIAASRSRFRGRAMELLLQILDPVSARNWLTNFQGTEDAHRMVVRGAGLIGTREMAEWLIGQMDEPKLARLAGESFSMITGCDLDELDLDGPALDGSHDGPTDDSEDDDVELDPDVDLVWPDKSRVAAWWQSVEQCFAPETCHFLGRPRSPQVARMALDEAYQRQRQISALYLAASDPKAVLTNCAKPVLIRSGAVAA